MARSEIEVTLGKFDDEIESGLSTEQLQSWLEKMEKLCLKCPQNVDILWRIGMICYKIQRRVSCKNFKQELTNRGESVCNKVIEINPDLAEGYKWLAMLIGAKVRYAPLMEKVKYGIIFRKNIEIAVKLNPRDPVSLHMHGRYILEVASLKWYERKIVKTLFAELPSYTFEESLETFLKVDRFTYRDWKENKLFIAKSQIKMNMFDEAGETLRRAQEIQENFEEDAADVDQEIKSLLKKFYRSN